jgi:hypothetical protein
VARSDGSVTYDSSKGDENTHKNATDKLINENHNTRPSMMLAQLSESGVGNEIKQSTSTSQVEAYQAKKITPFNVGNRGTVRLSKKST